MPNNKYILLTEMGRKWEKLDFTLGTAESVFNLTAHGRCDGCACVHVTNIQKQTSAQTIRVGTNETVVREQLADTLIGADMAAKKSAPSKHTITKRAN